MYEFGLLVFIPTTVDCLCIFFKDNLSMFKFTPFCCPSFVTASECSYCRVCETYSVPSKNGSQEWVWYDMKLIGDQTKVVSSL